MKCFERLVKDHITTALPPTLDPLQFAYRSNRSTEDAVSHAIHLSLQHLEKSNTYVRMLFVDYSSAFNTIIPQHLVDKLGPLGLSPPMCNWILDFLTDRPQSVRVGTNTSNTISLSTGSPQGCVLSPLLFTLMTHDCIARSATNHIIKYADDTTVVGLIRDDDEESYRAEVKHLVSWSTGSNLDLNVNKTIEVIIDPRTRERPAHTPLFIGGAAVEIAESTKFLGVHISSNLSWTQHTASLTKKANQRLHFLRRLRKAQLPPPILTTFYRGTIESILTSCISVWYGSCTAADRKALQRVVKAAAKITGTSLTSIEDIAHSRCLSKAKKIIADPTHPDKSLFNLLPTTRCIKYRSIKSGTTRFCNSFFPRAIRLLNSEGSHTRQ